jgi:hypothetical protein
MSEISPDLQELWFSVEIVELIVKLQWWRLLQD